MPKIPRTGKKRSTAVLTAAANRPRRLERGIPSQPARDCFRFLDLPREIRDMIYEYSLPVDRILRISTAWPIYERGAVQHYVVEPEPQPSPVPPALMLMCKQVNAEATEMLYEKCYIKVEGSPQMPLKDWDWVTTGVQADLGSISLVPQKYAHLVRNIAVEAREDEFISPGVEESTYYQRALTFSLEALKVWPNVKKLHLILQLHSEFEFLQIEEATQETDDMEGQVGGLVTAIKAAADLNAVKIPQGLEVSLEVWYSGGWSPIELRPARVNALQKAINRLSRQ